MIPVLRIVETLRYALKDTQGVTVSDFELIDAINQGVAYLYGRLGERYVYATLKKKILIVDNSGEAELPSDFIRIHQVGMGENGIAMPVSYLPCVERTYRIIGTRFYAPSGTYGLEYYYVPLRVKSLADDLDVPESMTSYIEQVSLAMFRHDLASAEATAQTCINTLGGRDISHFMGNSPTQILGGKV